MLTPLSSPTVRSRPKASPPPPPPEAMASGDPIQVENVNRFLESSREALRAFVRQNAALGFQEEAPQTLAGRDDGAAAPGPSASAPGDGLRSLELDRGGVEPRRRAEHAPREPDAGAEAPRRRVNREARGSDATSANPRRVAPRPPREPDPISALPRPPAATPRQPGLASETHRGGLAPSSAAQDPARQRQVRGRGARRLPLLVRSQSPREEPAQAKRRQSGSTANDSDMEAWRRGGEEWRTLLAQVSATHAALLRRGHDLPDDPFLLRPS
ncbi:hypothetical protein M885DRAFT_328156 [Pelagophyceae sp. CCMP2097]|nr:hypothetical protein M885DRAFT_328156 [Pelagophyceae sp. CCMP2097]